VFLKRELKHYKIDINYILFNSLGKKWMDKKGHQQKVFLHQRCCSKKKEFPGLFLGFFKKRRSGKVKFVSQKLKQGHNSFYAVNSAVLKTYL